MKLISCLTCCILLTGSASAAPGAPVPSWSDAEKAKAEVEHLELIGEYLSADGKTAIQANLLPEGRFLTATYAGGLPGAGWDKATGLTSELLDAKELQARLNGFKKIVRVSPTMGQQAPDDAILKYPEDFTNVTDGILMAGGKTTKDIGSFKMHMEFLMPLKPGRNLSNQDRGNSGIYIFNNYEIQVIDTFALDYENPDNNANPIESMNKQWCGCLYKNKLADVNMTLPPLQWQTYDIEFTAPVFEGETKVKNARITVFHNGVKIHDDFELTSGTGAGAKRPQLAEGPIFFQGHGNPVLYRNVWATAL